ncbi:MAG: Spy/CpxP family protein refolding chaperone [Hyphomicrobiales bacterium]|nr:Spy/CpxP family protein refolding chaperone [Hyphomicrobiales bacterium]MBV8440978.1 Spy/CpxP family protein refolding chaperone [Hyphomicrobiales bacterium]
MKHYLLASLTAAAVSASAFALSAAAAPNDQTSGAPNVERMQHWAADREAVLDAKLAGMKAGLKLTADQEKLWGPFETAVRDSAKSRWDAMQAMMETREHGERMSPIDHLDAMADRLSKAAADVKTIADAAKPLYASLDEGQKHSFGTLGRMLMPERARFAEEMWRRHEGAGMPE